LVFLTGDLGYKALEPLREALGRRFINAGVAEQNMVGLAAGLAREGWRPWVYSIAPFVYARPFEQIRNDVCLHNLGVKFVGNGGGYGYGVMGSTHHALEDYGTLLALQNMRVMIPTFGADVPAVVAKLRDFPHPAYLRLGASEEPAGLNVPLYAPWRRLVQGETATVLAVGPLAGPLWAAANALTPDQRPSLWILSELPIEQFPDAFLADVSRTQHLIVVEEHVAQGGVAQMLAARMLAAGVAPRRFQQFNALGYASGLYGSQKFHRKECALDAESILNQCRASAGAVVGPAVRVAA